MLLVDGTIYLLYSGNDAGLGFVDVDVADRICHCASDFRPHDTMPCDSNDRRYNAIGGKSQWQTTQYDHILRTARQCDTKSSEMQTIGVDGDRN